MMVNRLIDTLVAKRSHQFMVMPGLKEGPEYYADLLRRAEKFDFGALDNVLIKASDEEGRWSTPVLTAEENRFIDEGLVPLPAPLVWYEYVLNGKASGVIIEDNPQLGWCVNRIDYDRATGKGILDGVWVRFNKNHGAPNPNPALKFLYQIKHVPGAEPANTGCVMVDPTDCSLILAECSSDFYRTDPTFDPLKFEEDFGIASHMQFARYLTLMINSKTTSMEYVAGATQRPNRKTLPISGREPRHEFRRVTIVSREAIRQSIAEGERERMPPRLHWRRSHLRHFKERTAHSIWKGNEVHNGMVGWWVIVIARQLIGCSELGSISHEYLVKQETG